MATLDRWLDEAVLMFRSGQHAPAEERLRRILKKQPHHFEACYNLGTVLFVQGRPAEALPYLQASAELSPASIAAANNLGIVLLSLRRWEEAESALRKALQLNPANPDTLTNLATALLKHHIGDALLMRDVFNEPIALLRRSLALRPNHAETLMYLGIALEKQDTAWRRGDRLAKQKQYAEAVALLHQALVRLPVGSASWYETLSALVVTYGRLQMFEEALACGHQILAIRPEDPPTLFAIGTCLLAMGCGEEAQDYQERALQYVPENLELQYQTSEVYLRTGDFARGWDQYETRFIVRSEHPKRRAQIAYPQWQGEPLEGRRIFVSMEQGNGDVFQFVRYLPLVQATGAFVHFQCQHGQSALFARTEGFHEISERSPDERVILPPEPFDYWVPLMSLPRLFGTRQDTIPGSVPYLHADPERVQDWEERLAAHLPPSRLRVGLVWNGNPNMADDYIRSAILPDLAPLAQAQSAAAFVSLQKGPAAAQLAAPPGELKIWDAGPFLTDYMETAAAIQCLDLVIAVDTSLAHLTGALGKPIWLALFFSGEWRWLIGREDSPWYPTMRIFRQPRPWDWHSIFTRMASDLPQLKDQYFKDQVRR